MSNLKAQTFSNLQQTAIPNPGTVAVPITVSGLPSQIDTLTYGLESVNVQITHPTLKELTLKLQSPDGKVIFLSRKSPGKNYNTTFDAVALRFIDNNEIAAYSGSYTSGYRPRQDLALLNNAQDPNGTWNLIVIDDNSASTAGTVTGISLVFGNTPAKPLLSSSSLPIIKIYTDNAADIVDDPKVLGDMYIINNGTGAYNYTNQSTYQYRGKIGIEIRGNSSANDPNYPKKQYGFETKTADGASSADVSLFGMPAQSDWILSAVMSDKSLMRNVLTYQLARDMGWWASRTQYCELVINDEYRGVFIFEEKIKKDKNRVPIEKMITTDITEPNVTGGYIFSMDDLDPGDITWQSKFDPKPVNPYKFVYPKPEDLQAEQRTYLQNYVGDFETALHGDNFQDTVNGFRKYADDKSFIDYFLISEFAKNNDSYRYSTYFYKKRGGKIVAMPVWDFDRAYRNEATCNSASPAGYIYSGTNNCDGRIVQWWWPRLLKDTKYKQDMVCRYNTLRQSTLSQQHLYHIIDSSAGVLNAGAQQRNFIRWNILGKYVERNPAPYPATYAIEIDTLKQWIGKRLNWLDTDLGTCNDSVLVKYSLVVNAVNGTVTKSPNEADYQSGSNVSLTATPAAGYQFSDWSGDASGSTNPLTVVMSKNKTITANFTVAGQPVTTLTPDADAFVRNGSYATKNYGSDLSLMAKSSTVSGYSRSSYLKFSLGSVSNVSSAKLRIYGSNTQNTTGVALSAYGVSTDSWLEGGITWSTAPAASTAVLSSVSVTDQAKYYELDVTSFVQAQLAGDKTASFLIKDASNKNIQLVFNSKENSANKPQLIIATSSSGNQAPVLAAIGNKTATVGQELTFTATATDPDAGQTKTFSLIGAPDGAAIGETSGVFRWTPALAGSSMFTVRVTDNGSPQLYDEEQITVTVNSNTDPSFTLAPIADAFVRNGSYATKNYGGDISLMVKSSTSSGYSRSSYLKFSLSSVSNVSTAKLRIYGSNTQNTSSILISAFGVTSDAWTETGITWSNAPAPLSTVLGSVSVTNQAKYYELNVTGFVQAQLAGDKTASFLVKDASNKNTQLMFNSKENTANKPQLIVQTSTAITARSALRSSENSFGSADNSVKTKIYPNPVSKRFNIELSRRYEGNVNLQFVDELGRTRYLKNVRLKDGGYKMVVDISDLSMRPGVYFLKIQSTKKSEVIKVIVL